MKVDDPRYIAYRLKLLPEQLDRARRRVLHLEREAARLGMKDLLRDSSSTSSSNMAV
jgi:hypothetical protein